MFKVCWDTTYKKKRFAKCKNSYLPFSLFRAASEDHGDDVNDFDYVDDVDDVDDVDAL